MNGFDGVVVTPADLGGTPQTMPTNNWFDGIGVAVSNTVNATQRAALGYVQVQEAAALVRSAGVPSQNRAPGTFGLNPQASTVPGVYTATATQNINGVVLWIGIALVGFMILKKVMK